MRNILSVNGADNGLPAITPAKAPSNREDKGPSQADQLVTLAHEHYRVGRSPEGLVFLVPKAGPKIALAARDGTIRQRLAAEHRKATNKTPNSSALSDALVVIEGDALDAEPEPLAVRVAQLEDTVFLDLGTATGDTICIGPNGWSIYDNPPVIFRRTGLIGPMEEPARGGNLDDLRSVLNIADGSWPLVVGWLVASMMADLPCPILLLGGEQGSGKTTAAKMIGGVVDPSPAPVRSGPRDIEQWAISASSSWIVAVDNVSAIQQWWSDALCRCVTGDSLVRRQLYSDFGVTVATIRRPVILTSIDAGAMRGDLGERLLLVELLTIPPEHRIAEADLWVEYHEVLPGVRGALFDLTSKVLAILPKIRPPRLSRMADFTRIMHALDEVGDFGAVRAYDALGERIAHEVVDGDLVASAVVGFIDRRESWSGTASELHHDLTPERPPRGWPGAAHTLSGALKRSAPALRACGITVEWVRCNGERVIKIERRRDG